MDKSRPRHPTLKSPLIQRPDLQTRGQRTLYGSLTIAFWAFWIYLWVPLLALLAWLLGIEEAYKYMIKLGGYRETMRTFESYALVVLLLGGTLMLWAGYNIYRFRGVDKRTARPAVTTADISRDLDQDHDLIDMWHGERLLWVTHDEGGRLIEARAIPR